MRAWTVHTVAQAENRTLAVQTRLGAAVLACALSRASGLATRSLRRGAHPAVRVLTAASRRQITEATYARCITERERSVSSELTKRPSTCFP